MKNAVDVARDRPSRASSEAERHPARSANDGSAKHWLAATDEPLEWWQVDLEGFYEISTLKITFTSEGNYRFVVETSTNGISWTTAIDRTATENVKSTREDIFPPGITARYVRMTFHSTPPPERPNLVDLKIFGILSVR
jgi:hypothetical protein